MNLPLLPDQPSHVLDVAAPAVELPVAAHLNNTREVCRKSYVNPRVPEAYVEGALHEAFGRAEARDRLRHSEAAVLILVEGDAGAVSPSCGARRRR